MIFGLSTIDNLYINLSACLNSFPQLNNQPFFWVTDFKSIFVTKSTLVLKLSQEIVFSILLVSLSISILIYCLRNRIYKFTKK